MKIVVACDKFKGSLTAAEACDALEAGLRDAGFEGEIDCCPIADGGEGFVEAMIAALHGEWRECPSFDALGRPITAKYGMCRSSGDKIALIEMAEASGLWRIAEAERDIMESCTAGTGRMIRHAVQVGKATVVLVGIGGSATNDGGVGMAAALGIAFRDRKGWELRPVPAEMETVAEVFDRGRIRLPTIEVACDVENPLLGPNGATAVYGPQKGAGPEEQERLERFLENLVAACEAEELAERPGAGAAGGLGFGLVRFADAVLRPGFEMVADALRLEERLAEADVVITGEGSLDAQSLSGKGPLGVARMARALGKRVIGCAGRVTEEVRASGEFDATFSLESFALPLEDSMRRGAELLRETAKSEIAARLSG